MPFSFFDLRCILPESSLCNFLINVKNNLKILSINNAQNINNLSELEEFFNFNSLINLEVFNLNIY